MSEKKSHRLAITAFSVALSLPLLALLTGAGQRRQLVEKRELAPFPSVKLSKESLLAFPGPF
ncbi:MAG: hypothetical protein JO102_01085, partial [Elusimicrobia bacterium]|nr:hypothetical protein [Elusimicrobiota bacterium]